MMTPLPNTEHQDIVGGLVGAFREVVRRSEGMVLPGVNVSDREKDWKYNYRCPDVVVFFAGGHAKDFGTHWCGGPDFAVEIRSDDDQTREKIPFYEKIGTRELLIIEREPWSLELLRLVGGELRSVGTVTEAASEQLSSEILLVSFRLVAGDDRPSIRVVRSSDGRARDI